MEGGGTSRRRPDGIGDGGRGLGTFVPAFAAWVDGLAVWGAVAFVAGSVVATVALVPGSLLTLAAGAIFGLAWCCCARRRGHVLVVDTQAAVAGRARSEVC